MKTREKELFENFKEKVVSNQATLETLKDFFIEIFRSGLEDHFLNKAKK